MKTAVRHMVIGAVLLPTAAGAVGLLLWLRPDPPEKCVEYTTDHVSPWFSTHVIGEKMMVCFDASTGSIDVMRCVEMKPCPPVLPSEEDL